MSIVRTIDMTDTPPPRAIDHFRISETFCQRASIFKSLCRSYRQFATVFSLICGLRNELSNHDYLNNVSFLPLLTELPGVIAILLCLHSSPRYRCQIALKTAPLFRIGQEMSRAHDQGSAWSEISERYGVCSRTAQSWVADDMTLNAQDERRSRAGRSRKLTHSEEDEILERARKRREEHGCIDGKWTRATIADVTNGRLGDPSGAMISKFWQMTEWPMRRVQARSVAEVRETLRQDAEDFQRTVVDYVREAEIAADNISVADETGMWSGSFPLRTRVNPARMDAGVLREGDNLRDNGMVALSAAGQVDAAFLPHQKQKTRQVDGQTVVVEK
jgi:hypothetical protein